ncbi:tetratricopeptide repeat-containing sensor histidine kinase [uncultured Microscilla sp.]|uniref:tetratricopeptide repeat-containing sensor histidine kinase n=1 Tax=uncultured Microscilla sp. TaxID=432653 RepID=UPI00261E9882|nr:tetratricopeptide repeat-containing sensor histidine kinase [uncultured Microscilla sp.]
MNTFCKLCVLIFITSHYVFGQNPRTVDSLQKVLKTTLTNQQKVDVYNLLAKEYRYMDSARVAHYTSRSISLSNTIQYPQGVADAWYYLGFVNLVKGKRVDAMQFFEKILRLSQKIKYKGGVANAYNGIGATYWFKGNMDKALGYYQKSLKIRTQIKDKKGMASTCVNIGTIYKYQGKNTQAIEIYHKALRIEKKLVNKKGIAKCYSSLANIYTDEGDYPKALNFYQRAAKLGKEVKDTLGLSTIYNNMGIVYSRQGNYPKAILLHQRAIAIDQLIKDKRSIAVNYNNLGIIYRYQGNYPKALEAFQKSLMLREKIKSKQGIAQSFNNIGDIYKTQGDYAKALVFFHKALQKYTQVKYKRGIAISYNNLGIVHELKGNYHKALAYYQQALALEKQLKLKAKIADSYLGLGRVALLQKQYTKAHDFFEKALKMREVMGEKAMSAEAQINLGMAYYSQKNYSKAQEYLNKGLHAATKTGMILFIKYGAEYLAKTYQATGKPQKALENHMLFKQMADSLLNKKNIQKIARLETQYMAQKRVDSLKVVQTQKDQLMQADIRRREATQRATYLGLGLSALLFIVLLMFYRSQKRHNRKLSLVNAELEESYITIRNSAQLISEQKNDLEQALQKLKELDSFKEKMVGMIAHDLKNPLQAIMGFTQDAHLHPQANAIHQAAQRMLLLILNMLDAQKFTKTEVKLKKSTQCLPALGKTTLAQVEWFAQAKNIRLEQSETQEMYLPLDTQLVSRVLLNLLHNAIKFTPNNGHITLQYEAMPATQEIKVMVSDNGEGIAPEHLATIFKPYHQANAKQASTGLGLAFCKMVVEAHQGSIGVTSTLGKGSTFWFTLPMPETIQPTQTLAKAFAHTDASALCLTPEDKAYLKPYLNKIKEHKIYHFTKIKSILQQIDDHNHPDLARWKNTLKQAMVTANQPQYESLINMH